MKLGVDFSAGIPSAATIDCWKAQGVEYAVVQYDAPVEFQAQMRAIANAGIELQVYVYEYFPLSPWGQTPEDRIRACLNYIQGFPVTRVWVDVEGGTLDSPAKVADESLTPDIGNRHLSPTMKEFHGARRENWLEHDGFGICRQRKVSPYLSGMYLCARTVNSTSKETGPGVMCFHIIILLYRWLADNFSPNVYIHGVAAQHCGVMPLPDFWLCPAAIRNKPTHIFRR